MELNEKYDIVMNLENLRRVPYKKNILGGLLNVRIFAYNVSQRSPAKMLHLV